MPANDERVGEMILTGRNMMPAFGQVMSQRKCRICWPTCTPYERYLR